MATVKKMMKKSAPKKAMMKKAAPKAMPPAAPKQAPAQPAMNPGALGPQGPMMKKGGKMKKAQKGAGVKPTYKNLKMGVTNENYLMSGVNRDIKPSASDSARYRGGFEQGLKGMKGSPNEGQVEKMGRWEGQNVNKTPKQKMGGKIMKGKKAVKAGVKTMKKKAMTVKGPSSYKMGGKMSKKK